MKLPEDWWSNGQTTMLTKRDLVPIEVPSYYVPICNDFGERLYRKKKANDRHHYRDNPARSMQANADGKLAEVAFALRFDLEDQLDFEVRDVTDGNVDFTIEDGRTIDVKRMGAYWYDFNPLLKEIHGLKNMDRARALEKLAWAGFVADVGVMVWKRSDGLFTLVGWIPRGLFIGRSKPRSDFTHGLRWTVRWNGMEPISHL
jgi:hypothetical protein